MELRTYDDDWSEDDPFANFKAEVALYSRADPLPTLEALSRSSGIPAESLVRYILVKWAASGAEALLAMEPMVFRQMEDHIRVAEEADTDVARLRAYESLRQMIAWLRLGSNEQAVDTDEGR